MKKRILIATLVFSMLTMQFMVSAADVSPKESKVTDAVWSNVEKSFFLSDEENITVNESAEIQRNKGRLRTATEDKLPKNLSIIYSTDTKSRNSYAKFAEDIKNGATLESLLQNDGRYYGSAIENNQFVSYEFVTNDEGQIELSQKVTSTELDSNETINLTSTLKNGLLSTDLDINNTSAKHVRIFNVAFGILFSDEKSEYFVPSVNSYDYLNAYQVYAISEIADIMLNNINIAFPEIEYGEDGNAVTGGKTNAHPNNMPDVSSSSKIVYVIPVAGLLGVYTLFLYRHKAKQ